VLLLDLAMPKKDGFIAVKEIMQIDPHAKLFQPFQVMIKKLSINV